MTNNLYKSYKFLYTGGNNNSRSKNIRANIYNIKPKTSEQKKKFANKKQTYMQNTGSMFSLLKKKYNLTREIKGKIYDPTNKIDNKKLGEKNSQYKNHGKPIQNPSLGSSSALSRAIQRRITTHIKINNKYIN
jgi:hypothetical protein